MKKIFFVAALALLCAVTARADKKPLDHTVYDNWQRVEVNKLSKDAEILVYSILRQEGDAEMHVRRTATGEELVIPRGSAWSMTEDGEVATLTIKAPYAATRKAKIDKKKEMPKDTLAYVRLSDMKLVKLTGKNEALPDSIASKKAVKLTNVWVARASSPYVVGMAEDPAKKGRKMLLFMDYKTEAVDTLRGVDNFWFTRKGDRIAVLAKKDDKDSTTVSCVYMYDFATGKADTLSRDRKVYRNLQFNHEGDKLVFTASDGDAKKVGTTSNAIFLAEQKVISKATRRKPAVTAFECREIVPENYDALPEGWIIGDGTTPKFSNKADRLVLNLRKYMAPKDTTVIDFEAAKLDIWLWNSLELPPAAKMNSNAPELTAVINLDVDPGKVVVLSKSPQDRVSTVLGAEGDYAMITDYEPYALGNFWELSSKCDVSIINYLDGSRTPVSVGESGKSISPKGKYLTWFSREDECWYAYNVARGTTVNLTAGLPYGFRNTDQDTPYACGPWSGPFWLGEDEYCIITDRYDLWKIHPDGLKPAECITAGEGRRTGVQYRVTWFESEEDSHLYSQLRTVPVKTTLWLTAFDENTKKYGYARVSTVGSKAPAGFTDGYMFTSVSKKKGYDLIIYQKGNFNEPADLYITRDNFATEEKITAINPQQAEYNWGNAQLVEWKAYDGTPLKGILYTPENLDPSKKYPMISYFYEKNTQNLYQYYAPVPSRSIIGFPYYVSNGYVVFVPDIVYKDGHPGESAYNCICSGCEAMCEQFSFIDKSRMAIQGQSWGGYQVAYLVTRTNMFACGGAGAPVGNMTSAYGGIRWGTGMSRITQYEHGQSRVGKTLWEEGARDLYIENSPVFHADKVNTPVLIMSNDADGAVPWYQGIEFFMCLRRLGKPAWLLQYNGEAHNISQRKNAKDLTVRLQQFFDHYLKDAPAPSWMVKDIPQSLKGNYFGFELTEKQ